MSQPPARLSAAFRSLLLVGLSLLAGNACAHHHTDAHPLEVERVGGIAGFGAPGSRLQSRGQVDVSTLSAADREVVSSLFSNPGGGATHPDELRYRLTRWTAAGPQTIEVPEDRVPPAVRSAVHDELR